MSSWHRAELFNYLYCVKGVEGIQLSSRVLKPTELRFEKEGLDKAENLIGANVKNNKKKNKVTIETQAIEQ
jgi:hypothetical protein